jgi:hypothetical protein
VKSLPDQAAFRRLAIHHGPRVLPIGTFSNRLQPLARVESQVGLPIPFVGTMAGITRVRQNRTHFAVEVDSLHRPLDALQP